MRELLDRAVVLKFGTSTLTSEENGVAELDTASFVRIGGQVDEAVAAGWGVVLVSSGARMHGWRRVVRRWDAAIHAETKDFLFTDEHLDSPDGWRGAFDVTRLGGVAIVNANDPELPEDSSYHNNDIVAATLAVHIRWVLGANNVQLGMLSDVPGVLLDVADHGSTIPVIDDLDRYSPRKTNPRHSYHIAVSVDLLKYAHDTTYI